MTRIFLAFILGVVLGFGVAVTGWVFSTPVATEVEECFTDACVGCVNDCLDSQ